MPKKKLTKAQVHKKWRSCTIALYDLLTDKLAYPDSHVGMSVKKLIETHTQMVAADRRMK